MLLPPPVLSLYLVAGFITARRSAGRAASKVLAAGLVALVLLLSMPNDEHALWAWVTVFVLSKLAGVVALVVTWGLAAMWADDPMMRWVTEMLEED